MRACVVAAGLAIFAWSGAGCGVPAPDSGPAPIPSPAPAPARNIRILVTTADSAFRPLSDVKVEILNGPIAGETAIATRGYVTFNGNYSGVLNFRATKDDYENATGTLNLNIWRDPSVSTTLYLRPISGSATLEPGTYSLTFIAASSCSVLPEELRVRRYAATVTLDSQSGVYTVAGSGEFLTFGGFALGIAGNYATFLDDMGFWEQLPPFVYFDLWGSAEATLAPTAISKIEMTYYGSFRYCSLRSARAYGCYQAPASEVMERGECLSRDHRVILERR